MAEFLTVREIAKRIAPTTDGGAIDRIVRQLRHWTVAGALVPVGQVYGGAGKHRAYSGDAVPIAALLAELAAIGLPVGILRNIGLTINVIVWPVTGKLVRVTGRQRQLWLDAIAGDRRVYLAASYRVGDNDESTESGVQRLYCPDDENARDPVDQNRCSAIVVDLTELFSRLR